MPRPISAAYLERKLRAITGLKGDNPLPELADLAGLLTLENDRPEWAIAGNELLGIRGFDAAAGVAQFSFAIIENPDLSGVITIVEDIRGQPNNAAGTSNPFTVNLEIGGPLSTPPGGMTNVPFLPRDLRLFKPIAGPSPFATHLRDDGVAAVPMTGVPANNQLLTEVVLAGAQTNFLGDYCSGPWILPPGSRLWLQGVLVNNRIAGNVIIRERAIEGQQTVR